MNKNKRGTIFFFKLLSQAALLSFILLHAITTSAGIPNMFLETPYARESGITKRVAGNGIFHYKAQPWIGSLQYQNTHYCGAALIVPEWVITSARCVAWDGLDLSGLNVWMGSATLLSNGIRRGVIERIYAPGFFTFPGYASDLALLKLSEPVTDIQPAIIPTPALTDLLLVEHDNFTVSGWGATRPSGASTTTLLNSSLKITDYDDCAAFNGNAMKPQMFCGGKINDSARACAGDHGAPVWTEHEGVTLLTGTVGIPTCGNTQKWLDVYMKTSTFRDWLERTADINLPTYEEASEALTRTLTLSFADNPIFDNGPDVHRVFYGDAEIPIEYHIEDDRFDHFEIGVFATKDFGNTCNNTSSIIDAKSSNSAEPTVETFSNLPLGEYMVQIFGGPTFCNPLGEPLTFSVRDHNPFEQIDVVGIIMNSAEFTDSEKIGLHYNATDASGVHWVGIFPTDQGEIGCGSGPTYLTYRWTPDDRGTLTFEPLPAGYYMAQLFDGNNFCAPLGETVFFSVIEEN